MGVLNLGFSIVCKYFFNIITGWFLIDFARLMLPFNNIEISESKKETTIAVAVLAIVYWVIRIIVFLVNYFIELPYKRHEREINKEIKEMQLDELKRKKDILDLSDEMDSFKKEKNQLN